MPQQSHNFFFKKKLVPNSVIFLLFCFIFSLTFWNIFFLGDLNSFAIIILKSVPQGIQPSLRCSEKDTKLKKKINKN